MKADLHVANLRPVIEQLEREGVTTPAGIAGELNARAMRTPRGGQWHKSSVTNLVARLAA